MKKILSFIAAALFASQAIAIAPNDFFAQVSWDDQADSFLQFVPDPGTNAILAWDPTSTSGRAGVGGTGGMRYWTLGSGLSYSSGVLSVVGKQNTITTGSTSQYFKGDLSLGTFPTALSSFTNDAGFITSGALSPYLTSSSSIASSQITGTKSSSFISDFVSTARTSISVTGNGSYNSSTGVITVNNPTARTFSYPARNVGTCYQVSTTQDADVNYSIDISAAITLGGGTGSVTTYTNSGCSTGAQLVFNGAVSSVALGGTSSIPLHAIVPAGKWVKIAAAASGGGTAAIDATQAETLLP